MSRIPEISFSDLSTGLDKLGSGEWITVYETSENHLENAYHYSAIVSEERVAECLERYSWDLSIGDGKPGFSGDQIYYRHAKEGIEPIVLARSFYSLKKSYKEISEEFRLYFDLYDDKQNGKLILIDTNGDDEEAVIITPSRIQIKARLLKEFLHAKKAQLALYFSVDRFSEKSIPECGVSEFHKIEKGQDFIYEIGARPWHFFSNDERRTHAFFQGKKFIHGSKDLPFFNRWVSDKKHIEFIVGVDHESKEILSTCDEAKLSSTDGDGSSSHFYLTPVFFRQEVLTKYYSQPDKFSVEDGYLHCGGLWGLHMDNNHPDAVMVFLGDLGTLSYKEQLHWRSSNIVYTQGMSHTAFKRAIEGEFEDPERADLVFKQRFAHFNEKWTTQFGWNLFLPLSKDDSHYLSSLRIPLTNEQKEFDEQVLALTKVFIDSLNEVELAAGLKLTKANSKGLDKLEGFLERHGVANPAMFDFLRNLQSLRSTSVAHRKGKNYDKIKGYFFIDEKNRIDIFEEILIKCVKTLNTLTRIITELAEPKS